MVRTYYFEVLKDGRKSFIGKAEFERLNESGIPVIRKQGRTRLAKRELILTEDKQNRLMLQLEKIRQKEINEKQRKIVSKLEKQINKLEQKKIRIKKKRQVKEHKTIVKDKRDVVEKEQDKKTKGHSSIFGFRRPRYTYLRFDFGWKPKEKPDQTPEWTFKHGVSVKDGSKGINDIGSVTRPDNFNRAKAELNSKHPEDYDTMEKYIYQVFEEHYDDRVKRTVRNVKSEFRVSRFNGKDL